MKDVIIIGGGIAGLTSGIYTKRNGLDSVLYEMMFPGGQASTTYLIENYPGFVEPISGPDFAMKLQQHAERFNLEIINDTVLELDIKNKVKRVKTADGWVETKAIILCTGAYPRTLGLDKEDMFRGRGVSYCATCDGAFYRDKVAAVVGGGDTAAEDALFLAQYAKKVYLIHRRDELRAYKRLSNMVISNPKIEVLWSTTVEKITGEDSVTGLKLNSVKDSSKYDIACDGMFVAIGIQPKNELVIDKLVMNKSGFVIADNNMATSEPGIFVAGDLRDKPLWQLITAASDGAVAALSAHRYIMENFD